MSAALPVPRGPVSTWLLGHLRTTPHDVGPGPVPTDDPLVGDDSQLALHLCYELHYRGLDGVDDGWEWEPSLLATRAVLEQRFLGAVIADVGMPSARIDAVGALRRLVDTANGPSLSRHLLDHGSLQQFREFAVHRSAYQLKEADPHTWAIPRLHGPAKAGMVQIQVDEYGGGMPARMHAVLFARTMDALGLDSTYGAYLDVLPGPTLATGNLVSLFGLHRRWRGACVGHLAVFEMTSVTPMERYAEACGRFGLPELARRFYDVHVTADSVHKVVALRHMVAPLVTTEPTLAADIVFGGRALMAVEGRFTQHLLDAWRTGGSSLRQPLLQAIAA